MAQAKVRPGMMRISVTVEQEVLLRVRKQLDELKLPRGEISVFVRMALDAIEKQLALMVSAKKSGKQLTLADHLANFGRVVGQQLMSGESEKPKP